MLIHLNDRPGENAIDPNETAERTTASAKRFRANWLWSNVLEKKRRAKPIGIWEVCVARDIERLSWKTPRKRKAPSEANRNLG
jgi:hypothetical protein